MFCFLFWPAQSSATTGSFYVVRSIGLDQSRSSSSFFLFSFFDLVFHGCHVGSNDDLTYPRGRAWGVGWGVGGWVVGEGLWLLGNAENPTEALRKFRFQSSNQRRRKKKQEHVFLFMKIKMKKMRPTPDVADVSTVSEIFFFFGHFRFLTQKRKGDFADPLLFLSFFFRFARRSILGQSWPTLSIHYAFGQSLRGKNRQKNKRTTFFCEKKK